MGFSLRHRHASSLVRHPGAGQLEAGRGLVRIPMEQDVPFTPRVRALVDTREFQRLRHVSQLGLDFAGLSGGDAYAVRARAGRVS